MNTELNWALWPRAGATSEPLSVSEETEKRAEVIYSDHSLEGLLQGVVAEIPSWDAEMSVGIEKYAAARFGNVNEGLPVVNRQNIWRHPNAHPLALALLLGDKYSMDFLEWEPETLRRTLYKDGGQLSESSWVKILAIRTLILSPTPWRQWEQFQWLSRGLAGRAPNFVYLEQPEIGFLMAAVDSMKLVDRSRPFAEDIDKFVAVSLRDQGIMYAPPPLNFAQEELSDRRLVCRKCGTREKDDHDIKCISCGSKDLEKHAGPHEALVAGTKALFDSRKRLPLEQAVTGLPSTADGNAAYKLLVHNEYRNEVRHQLISQLRMLRTEG